MPPTPQLGLLTADASLEVVFYNSPSRPILATLKIWIFVAFGGCSLCLTRTPLKC
jgi:hypothetical protein